MAITNICPLTGIATTIDTILNAETNYLHHILSLNISELNKLGNEANMPRQDKLLETKLLFCAYAKQAKLLIHNRQLLDIDDKVIVTHYKLLQSLAIYLTKEPKFYNRIPKYAHYTGTFVDNFGHYLELLKKEKELYIEERKQLKQKYKEQETLLSELEEVEIAEAKLGLLASKYAARLKLTEETSNGFTVSKQLAQYIVTAVKVSNEVREYFTYLISSPVSKLRNDSDVKEIDLAELIESIEDWDTRLNIKYAMLSFLRKKLTAYNTYEGRKVSKIDISDLDFLLGDIELVESKTVESSARSEAVTNNAVTNSVNSVNNSANKEASGEASEARSEAGQTNWNKPMEAMIDKAMTNQHKPTKGTAEAAEHSFDNPTNSAASNTSNSNSANSTASLAASILAKIAARKKGK